MCQHRPDIMATNRDDPGRDVDDLRKDAVKKPKCSPPDSPEEDMAEKSNTESNGKKQSGTEKDVDSANQLNEQTNFVGQSNTVCESLIDCKTPTENGKKDSTEETSMDVSEGTETMESSADLEGGDEACASQPKEMVDFKVMYNKQKYDVSFDLDGSVTALKEHLQTLTGVPLNMQKLMYRGLIKDNKTLRELNVTKGVKLMLIGSTVNDVMEVNKPVPKAETKGKDEKAPVKEPLCKQKMHKKILDKGKPEDVLPGIKGRQEALPSVPISGMYNKAGGKVRLTFKLEIDQLWIGTKERTEKLPMSSIKNVISEPIEGYEEYHIMAIQLGPTEQSRYWLYWVPTQYTSAIKDAILFKWQYF